MSRRRARSRVGSGAVRGRVARDLGGARAVDGRRRRADRAHVQRVGQSGKCSPTVTLDQPATMVNPALLQLTVSPTASTYTAATTDMDRVTGLATFTPISLTVQANRAWTIQVNGNAAFWTASAGAWASKPVSDLIWSLTPAGPTTAMSTTATTLTTGSPGPGSPGVSVYMRPVAHWATDKPGTTR